MVTPKNGDDWNRWRGEIDARLVGIERSVGAVSANCLGCRGTVDDRLAELHKRITRLEIRVAWYAGGAAAIGGILGPLVVLLVEHLF